MRAAFALVLLVACGSPKPEPSAAPPPSAQPSQNEQLYARGEQLEKEGKWEEAANAYQRYVFAMGDALTYIDRSSMELRIKTLREKVAISRRAE